MKAHNNHIQRTVSRAAASLRMPAAEVRRYPIRFHIEPRLVCHVAFSVSTIILETDNHLETNNHFSYGVML